MLIAVFVFCGFLLKTAVEFDPYRANFTYRDKLTAIEKERINDHFETYDLADDVKLTLKDYVLNRGVSLLVLKPFEDVIVLKANGCEYSFSLDHDNIWQFSKFKTVYDFSKILSKRLR